MLPASCRKSGNSACRPRRNGSMHAARERPPRRHSATSSAASKRTSKASRITERSRGRPWAGPRVSEVIPRIRGDYTICTGISSNGAAIGITTNSPAVWIRICIWQKHLPGCAEAGVGQTRDGPAGPPFDCDSNPNGATTTSAFELPSSKSSGVLNSQTDAWFNAKQRTAFSNLLVIVRGFQYRRLYESHAACSCFIRGDRVCREPGHPAIFRNQRRNEHISERSVEKVQRRGSNPEVRKRFNAGEDRGSSRAASVRVAGQHRGGSTRE